MRGAPAWHRRRSVQHPSTVSSLRADPPSPTRGEGKLSTVLACPSYPAGAFHGGHRLDLRRSRCRYARA
ncbi:MAG: hypothetical protein EOR78_12785 [Mesorhizobium sp.]|nr:MAG: hypothetical protein EOR49_11525 [Mesorhizobium sp.]RWM49669.1 MAG: hypothetical protein EOR76_08980 [Mesorhizobium sp.]RWM56067.1 MAG: hypothetical protein EOR78_12785 [Mesorhizobium sp.]RWM59348.1 MAG: hypothetical protein EOR79_11160 [Mesorhizobium sp.]RWN01949.1 MAG: hypothetical protein EOR85_14805 [Mesorhizobium sp.]